MKRYSVLLAFLFLLVCLVLWLAVKTPSEHPVYFETADDFREFARGHDFHIQSAGQQTAPAGHFFVTAQPKTWKELNQLSKLKCGLALNWKGVVWVTSKFLSSDRPYGTDPRSIGGHYRVWGKVLAVGDEELLNRLEILYQEHKDAEPEDCGGIHVAFSNALWK